MRRKVVAVLVLLSLVAAFLPTVVSAAGEIFFTAINNNVQPLNEKTMPKYFDKLYIPYTFFSSDELGVYFAPGEDRVMIYSYTPSYKSLTFNVVTATVLDQDNNQYYFPAIKSSGLIYVPAYEVCKFFGFTLAVYAADPAPIVRIMNSTDVLNKPTFFSFNASKIREYYDAYTGTQASPSPGVSQQPPVTPTPGVDPTFESVSIYLSFFDLSPENFAAVLSDLDTYKFKCCFFVSAGEISDSADLLRRAAGRGHMIGIWLDTGTLDEYRNTSSLLFEAAKVKTILVSAAGSAAKAAEEMAASTGLIFWRPTKTYDAASKISYAGIIGKLTVLSGNRESIGIACTDKAVSVIGSFLYYLADKQYNVKRINEKTPPPKTPSGG